MGCRHYTDRVWEQLIPRERGVGGLAAIPPMWVLQAGPSLPELSVGETKHLGASTAHTQSTSWGPAGWPAPANKGSEQGQEGPGMSTHGVPWQVAHSRVFYLLTSSVAPGRQGAWKL